MDNIKSAREHLGVTQAELADLLGLNQSTISRFERGALELDRRTKLALEALVASHKGSTAGAEQAPA